MGVTSSDFSFRKIIPEAILRTDLMKDRLIRGYRLDDHLGDHESYF